MLLGSAASRLLPMPWLDGRDLFSFSDRLASRHSVVGLVVLALLISADQLLDREPITCAVPDNFSPAQAEYAAKVCWTPGSSDLYPLYFAPLLSNTMPPPGSTNDVTTNAPAPDVTTDNAANDSSQAAAEAGGAGSGWVPERNYANVRSFTKMPYIFLFMAFIFYLPGAVWKFMRRHPSVPLSVLADAAQHCHHGTSPDARDFLGRRFGQYLVESRSSTCSRVCSCGGTSLSLLYVAAKAMWVTAAAGNLSLIMVMLRRVHLDNMLDALYGGHFSRFFPTAVLCRFSLVTAPGQSADHLVTCSLYQNEFNQWMFTLVACACIFVLVVQSVTFFQIATALLVAPWRRGFIADTLTSLGQSDAMIKDFTDFLGRDGYMVQRLIAWGTSELVAAQMVAGAYAVFSERGGSKVMAKRSRDAHAAPEAEAV